MTSFLPIRPAPHQLPSNEVADDRLPLEALRPPESDRIDWRRMLRAVYRFKWFVLAFTVLGTWAGVWATRLFLPQYMVQSTLWIDLPNARGGGRETGPIRSSQMLEPSSWVELVKSYTVLDHVVREKRLYLQVESPGDSVVMRSFALKDGFRPGAYLFSAKDGAYELTTDEGIELDRGKLGDSVGVRLGFLWAPDVAPGQPVAFELLTPRDASQALGERLRVRMDPEGSFLRVEMAGTNPRAVTGILNAVIDRYVEVAAQLKKDKLTGLTKVLEDQLQIARRTLDSSERALEVFRVRNITEPSDRTAGAAGPAAGGGEGRDPVMASFFDQQVERDLVRRDRESLARWLNTPADARVPGVIEVLASVQASADLTVALKELSERQVELRSMKTRYAEDYAPVQRLSADIAALRNEVIPGLVRTMITGLRGREEELGRRIAGASGQLRQIPVRSLEEARLRRGATQAEDLYTKLQQRYEENKIEEASSIPDVRVLDAAASPTRPFKNTAPRIILLAFVGSLGLVVVGAVVYDRLDTKVRYPEQISHDLGLTILGVVPHVATRGAGYKLTRDQANEVLESLRGVCLSLLQAKTGDGPLVVTMSSPGPGDGKSFLSANLALTFSDSGHRTLLIDADLRRGVQHRRFQTPRRPGLTNLLRGEVSAEKVCQATGYPRLTYVPCGSRTHSAPELLGSPAMTQFLQACRARYDIIIVDSPPLTGGIDPFVLGTLTGNLALVLRTGFSNREIAAAKLDMMARLPIRLLGAVVNDVPRGGVYSYYSYYLPGYEGVDEAGEVRPPSIV